MMQFFAFALLAIVIGTLYQLAPETLWNSFLVIVRLAPLWLPPVLLFALWQLWVRYVRARYFSTQPYTLLEIRLPQEVKKSPLAMETVLAGMHFTSGETTFIDRYWFGKTRPWYSLELVSIGGNIHFFIWTRTFFRNKIESHIYAQYPEVEIYEVEDYTKGIVFEKGRNMLWGCDFKLSQLDAYPIKTYVDYGLESESTKEEQKVDPMANVIEYLSSVKPGHSVWLQFIIRATKPKYGQRDWKKEAQAEIDKILLRDPKTKGPGQLSPSGFPILPTLSEEEKTKVAAIERSINKLAFDVGIRGIYYAENANEFDPVNIVGMLGSFQTYNSNNLNRFTPTRYHVDYNYPWQDFRNMRQDKDRRRILEAYKRRSWFFEPHKTAFFTMTTEELATVFHFPGSVVQTPTVARVSSKKAEAPSNLPT